LAYKQKSHFINVRTAFALICLLSTAAPTFAQENAKPAAEKWRPKDGTYFGPGHNYDRCLDFGDLIVEFAEMRIGASETDCKIVNLTDTAPGNIKLNVTCTADEREEPYNEVIFLKRINEKTVFYRQTTNGKFKYSGNQFSYCPEEAQRMYIESKKIK
jgi:hypothetical protein